MWMKPNYFTNPLIPHSYPSWTTIIIWLEPANTKQRQRILKSRVFFPKYHRPTLLDWHSSFCTPKVSSLIYRTVLTYIISFCTIFFCNVRFHDQIYLLFKSLRIHPGIHVGFFNHIEEDLVPLLPAVLSYYPRGHQWIRTRFCGRDH